MGNTTMVAQLLKAGYKHFNAKDENGKTAVHLVCENRKIDSNIFKILMDHGAHVNTFDSEGNKPIHLASQYRNVDIVQMLLDRKVNLLSTNIKTGCTPLHEAAKGGNLKVMELLIENGHPIRARNYRNEFPISIAINYDYDEIIQYLNSHVPVVRTSRDEWFHGKLDRKRSENILKVFADNVYEEYCLNRSGRTVIDEDEERHRVTSGIFLVRTSVITPNDPKLIHVISVLHRKIVKNYIVDNNGKYYFLKNGPHFDSLEHLIEHYSRFSDGIVRLTQGVKNLTKIGRFSGNYQLYNIQQEIEIGMGTNLNIKEEDLQITEKLGCGQFGTVHLALLKTKYGGRLVAVKTLLDESFDQREFLREAKIMAKLRNPYIVNILAILENSQLMIVQEFMPFGALVDYLTSNAGSIDNRTKKSWAFQIATGMNYLVSQHFVHRDLSARNILMNSVNQLKISDFGLSRALGLDENYYISLNGQWPIKWYALECLNYGKFSEASDVWSYGVTLWEIYTDGDIPYEIDMHPDELISKLMSGLRLAQPDQCPDEIYELMTRCWREDPIERPTFRQLAIFFN